MKINRKIKPFLITFIILSSIIGFALAKTSDFNDFTGEGHGSCHGNITQSSSGYVTISSSSGTSVKPSETFTISIQVISFTEAQGNSIAVGFPSGTPGRGDNKEFTFDTTQKSASIDGSGNSIVIDFQITAPTSEQSYTIHADAIYRAGGSSSYFAHGDFFITVESLNTPPRFNNLIETADPLELGQEEIISVEVTDIETSISTVLFELENINYTMSKIIGDTYEYSWIPTTIGLKSYKIFANDTNDSWNSTSGSINVIDSSKPVLSSLIESADPLELGQAETIQINATDLSGISQVLIEINNVNYTMINLIGSIWEYSNWIPATTGEKIYKIYANDTEGNWNSLTDSITVQDTVKPSLTGLTESADPLELGETEVIQINATDLSGITTVLIEIANINYTMTNIGGLTWEYNGWVPTNTGIKLYTIHANDGEGNWNSLTSSIIIQDTIKPSLVNLVESADPLELGETEIIQINATDLSGITTVLIEIANINYTMTNIGGLTWEYNSWVPTNTGIKLYTIHANDGEGNWNSLANSITVQDTTSPKFKYLIESADPLPLGQNQTISINVYDSPGSGVKDVFLEYYNINHTMNFIGFNTWRWSNWKPLSIGNFNYTIYMVDNNDNTNVTSGSFTVFITEGPTIENLSKSADPLELGQLETIQADVIDTEGVSKVIIEIDGLNYTMTNIGGKRYEYTWKPEITGTEIFKIYANDSLNNWNQLVDSIVVLDTTPPTIGNLTENYDPLELGDTIIISIDAKDLSGIKEVIIEFENTNHTMNYIGGNTWVYDTWIPDTINNYTYIVYSEDNSDNWNTTVGVIKVIDTTSPILTNLYESADPLELGQTELIQINAIDLSPIIYMLIEIEGTNYTMSNIGGSLWEYNNWLPTSTGIKLYKIYTSDVSNNRNLLIANISVIDNKGPVLSNLNENWDPLELGETELIQINVTDLSGVSHVLIEIEGVNRTMSKVGSFIWEYNNWAPNSVGLKLYKIYANDTFGNWNSITNNITVVDTNGPTLFSLLESADPLELGETELIQINLTDFSSVFQVFIEINGVNYTMTNIEGMIWQYNSWIPNSIGIKDYFIYGRDSYNNWNSLKSNITVIDTVTPNLFNLSEFTEPIELGSIPIIQVDVEDFSPITLVVLETESVNYTMTFYQGSTWRTDLWTPNITGLKSYKVFAFDSSNNHDFLQGNITIIDTTGPSFYNLLKPDTPILPGESVTIQVEIIDFSGVSEVIIEYEGSNFTMINNLGDIWEYNILISVNKGELTFIIHAKDNNNNWNSLIDSIIVMEQQIKNSPITMTELTDLFIFSSIIFIIAFGILLIVKASKTKRFIH
ncbi:MAG: hypothetical protein ACFFEY_02720 [Candidatus Thorarchaeota archaeon]